MELVRRETLTDRAPGSLETALVTRAWQAAQVIPVTMYCLVIGTFFLIVSVSGGSPPDQRAAERRGRRGAGVWKSAERLFHQFPQGL